MSDPRRDPRVTRADAATTIKCVGEHIIDCLAWVKPHLREQILELVKDELARRADPSTPPHS